MVRHGQRKGELHTRMGKMRGMCWMSLVRVRRMGVMHWRQEVGMRVRMRSIGVRNEFGRRHMSWEAWRKAEGRVWMLLRDGCASCGLTRCRCRRTAPSFTFRRSSFFPLDPFGRTIFILLLPALICRTLHARLSRHREARRHRHHRVRPGREHGIPSGSWRHIWVVSDHHSWRGWDTHVGVRVVGVAVSHEVRIAGIMGCGSGEARLRATGRLRLSLVLGESSDSSSGM